jgi:FkbM family methyltransferase
LLKRSVRESCYRNVEHIDAALGEAPGTATLHLANPSGWHTMLPGLQDRSEGELEVQVRTLDELGPFDAVKIDVEGFEEQVLQGASHTLADPQLRIVFLDLHPQLGANVERVLDVLSVAGFDVEQRGSDEALAVRGALSPIVSPNPPSDQIQASIEHLVGHVDEH